MSNNVSLQQSLQEKVSEKIKASFIDLIPQDVFDQMVSKSLDEFLNGPRHLRFKMEQQWTGSAFGSVEVPNLESKYNPANDPNTLPGMIMAAFQKQGAAQLAGIMESEGFRNTWDNGRDIAGEVIQKAIAENADTFVQALFSNIIANAFFNVTQSIRQSNPHIHI